MTPPPLRTGFTTGACATAAAAAAAGFLIHGRWSDPVEIVLPRGQAVRFPLTGARAGEDWAEAGVIKDAGDDPDVTHGLTIRARVRQMPGAGLRFVAGEGVGTVTRPGLPIPPGEPAINPVPRQMIAAALTAIAPGGWEVTLSIPGGAAIAEKTWNPRLGILGGLSVLGTTGIVRPFSCAAWIASIHRGIDVARAAGLSHVGGATGAMSEAALRARHGLPDHALLDMGDFAGGMLKYLRRHPVPRLTIAGGVAKLAKLGQGALDLHSARSQTDFTALAALAGDARLATCNTVLEAVTLAPALPAQIAAAARAVAQEAAGPDIRVDVLAVDRAGNLLAEAG